MAPIQLIFDPTSVSFSPVEKMRKGGRIVYTNTKGTKDRVIFQTPTMALPFGLNCFTDEATGKNTYSIDLSFRGADVSPRLQAFQASMEALDELLLETATANEMQWLNSNKGSDIVREFMRCLVKKPNNSMYAPTVKAKMMDSTAVFDEARKETTQDALVKGCKVKCILEVSPVWFVNKSFGLSLKVLQVAIVSRPATLDSFAFVEDANEDEENGAATNDFVDDEEA